MQKCRVLFKKQFNMNYIRGIKGISLTSAFDSSFLVEGVEEND